MPSSAGHFERLLDLHDPELWAYVLGQAVPSDPAMRHVIEQIAPPWCLNCVRMPL